MVSERRAMRKLPGCVIFANVLHTLALPIRGESDPPISTLEVYMIGNHVTTLKLLNRVRKLKRGNDEELSE